MQQIQTTAWSESAVHAFADLGLRSCHYHHFIYQKRSKCSRFKPQQIIKSDPCNDCVTSTDSARMERHILLPLVALRVPQPWSELHAARRCHVAHVGWSTFRAQNKLLPRYPEIAWRLSLVLSLRCFEFEAAISRSDVPKNKLWLTVGPTNIH